MTFAILVFAVFWLAWSNGANDNFKGVATLYGSGTADYRRALAWAAITTVAGSLVSVALAGRLVKAFSGGGLAPEALIGTPEVLIAVGGAAALTILLATWLGMPTSTTHALTGALLGVSLTASASAVQWGPFLQGFAAPLLLSPLLAIALTAAVYPVLSRTRKKMGVTAETCVCIGECSAATELLPDGAAAQRQAAFALPVVQVDRQADCERQYAGRLFGISAQSIVDRLHYLSSGAVCFSRAVNDTPKIAALLLALNLADPRMTAFSLVLVTAAMAAGGLLNARKVAETMSRRITELNGGQGLTANLATAALVLFASWIGLPVSTTHVSCGAIFGIGLTQRRCHWSTVSAILATWITTLPLAAVLSALLLFAIR
jgi:PiT family inorganic phosphate transporter